MAFTLCCSTLCYVVFFFFFKQKTAYELRISDWSSDVCSSDLSVAAAKDAADALKPSQAVNRPCRFTAGSRQFRMTLCSGPKGKPVILSAPSSVDRKSAV